MQDTRSSPQDPRHPHHQHTHSQQTPDQPDHHPTLDSPWEGFEGRHGVGVVAVDSCSADSVVPAVGPGCGTASTVRINDPTGPWWMLMCWMPGSGPRSTRGPGRSGRRVIAVDGKTFNPVLTGPHGPGPRRVPRSPTVSCIQPAPRQQSTRGSPRTDTACPPLPEITHISEDIQQRLAFQGRNTG